LSTSGKPVRAGGEEKLTQSRRDAEKSPRGAPGLWAVSGWGGGRRWPKMAVPALGRYSVVNECAGLRAERTKTEWSLYITGSGAHSEKVLGSKNAFNCRVRG
jgi:hypothetical protein